MKSIAPALPQGIRVVAEQPEVGPSGGERPAAGERSRGRGPEREGSSGAGKGPTGAGKGPTGAGKGPTGAGKGSTGAGQEPTGSGQAAVAGDPILYINPDWSTALPWVVQGVTGREADMSLFGGSPTGDVVPRWQRLRDRLGFPSIIHSRQVHRSDVLVHTDVSRGLVIAANADGHATRLADVLLAVSVADCAPVSVAAPGARAVALLHAGWRGIAAGVLEAGVHALVTAFSAAPDDLYVHFGPAICGDCYNVSPEVPRELGLDERDATNVDIRAALAHRAVRLGIATSRITVSAHCTRHGDSPFFSHRAGCAERQIAVIGTRSA